jgi:hypothetical protein
MVHRTRDQQGKLYAKLVFVSKIDSFNDVQGSLLNNAELWKSVPNDAFFSAIRSAWAAYTTAQPAWDSQQPAALREDPDIAQLRAASQLFSNS